MISLDKTIQSTAVRLESVGVPSDRAKVKAESTIIGKLVASVGLLLCVAATGMAGMIVWKGMELTLTAVFFVLCPGSIGFILLIVGVNLISRDASPALAAVGDFIVKLIRAIRGN